MFTLSIDMEARFLQRFNRPQMINAGQLRHQLRRDYFHFADFTTRIRFRRDRCSRESRLRYLQARLLHLHLASGTRVIQDNSLTRLRRAPAELRGIFASRR